MCSVVFNSECFYFLSLAVSLFLFLAHQVNISRICSYICGQERQCRMLCLSYLREGITCCFTKCGKAVDMSKFYLMPMSERSPKCPGMFRFLTLDWMLPFLSSLALQSCIPGIFIICWGGKLSWKFFQNINSLAATCVRIVYLSLSLLHLF